MSFRLQNLLGAPYRGGNVVISDDATSLSSVGNRISSTDLIKSQTQTLPFEATSNISRVAVSPDGVFLLSVDDAGRATFVNLRRRGAVLHRISFNSPVAAVNFSPDGALIAVGIGKLIQSWRSPGFKKEFFSFNLEQTFADCAAAVTSFDWSSDSEYLLAGLKDLTARLFDLNRSRGRSKPFMFVGHRAPIVGAFFCNEKKSG